MNIIIMTIAYSLILILLAYIQTLLHEKGHQKAIIKCAERTNYKLLSKPKIYTCILKGHTESDYLKFLSYPTNLANPVYQKCISVIAISGYLHTIIYTCSCIIIILVSPIFLNRYFNTGYEPIVIKIFTAVISVFLLICQLNFRHTKDYKWFKNPSSFKYNY